MTTSLKMRDDQRGQTRLGWFLAWIQIGGGIHGVYSAVQFLAHVDKAGLHTYVPAIGGVLFYAAATGAGFLLLQHHTAGTLLSLCVQTLQVPSFVVGDSVWSISAGPKLVIGVSGLSLRLLFEMGSYFQVGLDDQVRELIGINVLACFWVYYLLNARNRSVAPHRSKA